jgi:cytochrome c oxidase subunit 2
MRPWRAAAVAGSAALVLAGAAGCEAVPPGAPSPLDPQTLPAARIAELGWAMIAVATLVCAVVLGALFAALFRRRPGEPGEPGAGPAAPASGGTAAVVIGGMALPAAVIVLTLAYTVYTLREVAGAGGPGAAQGPGGAHAAHAPGAQGAQGTPGGPPADEAPALAVHVTGRQWWWEVTYPDEQVVTANEIHVPADVPVRFAVTSEDVIHSFWVPQVAGKIDVLPRKTNTVTLRIPRPGVYRGLCAEFCGLQHAHMHLRLVVEPPAAFAAWLDGQRRVPPPPADSLVLQGQGVFLRASCAQCHAVRGVSSGGRGPDLTHVASRRTLGAGTHENTPAALAGWVADPQAMKPGNKMPPTDLSAEEVRAVVAYLESLE